MKITSIKTAATRGHGMHLWVRVTTDAGITGLGECVHGGKQAIAIIQYLEERLIGKDPFAIDAIFEDMRRRHVFDGGAGGALITALTGIEIALWDLKGKALNVPIYELMGGKFRDKIRVYADCQVEPGMNFDEIKQVVDNVLEKGFTALKIDVDIDAYGYKGSEVADFQKDKPSTIRAIQWEHERMVQLVDMVTSAAGKDVAVAADVHTRLDVPSAIRLVQRFGALPPDVAGRTRARREHQGHARGEAALQEPHLRRGESLPAPRLPRPVGAAGGGHHHARHSQVRRAVGVPQDREHGGTVLHPLCAPQCLVAHRHNGLGPCLRHRAQLPGAGIPLAAPGLLDNHHPGEDGHHPERFHPP
jgi:hypothetical protein